MKEITFKSGIITLLTFGVFLPAALFLQSHIFFPEFRLVHHNVHTAIEAVGVPIAFFLAWTILAMVKNNKTIAYRLWPAIAMIMMGVLDAFHASVPPGDTFVWLHSASKLAGGFFFALVWIPNRYTEKIPEYKIAFFATSSVFFFALFFVVFPETVAFFSSGDWPVLLTGFFTAFISGYAAIAVLFRVHR